MLRKLYYELFAGAVKESKSAIYRQICKYALKSLDHYLDGFVCPEDARKNISPRLNNACTIPIYLDVFRHRFGFIDKPVAELIQGIEKSSVIPNEQVEFHKKVKNTLQLRRAELEKLAKNAIRNRVRQNRVQLEFQ